MDGEAAAQTRNAFRIPVFCCPPNQAGFADEEFDAVVMSHVFEHFYDPIGLLRESSLDRSRRERMGARPVWRVVARTRPPRHLFLLSRKTLEDVARTCGFRDVMTSTTDARTEWTVGQSLRVEQGECVREVWTARQEGVHQALLHAQALPAGRHNPDVGDECVLRARK